MKNSAQRLFSLPRSSASSSLKVRFFKKAAPVLSLFYAASVVAAPVKLPPAPASISTAPLPENSFFERDPHDPRVLLKKSSLDEVGINREYVEMMARPPIPTAALDAIDAARPDLAFQDLPALPSSPLALPNAATIFNGNIMIIEGDGNTVVNTENGLSYNHNSGIQFILQEVIGRAGDNFDFITVFTAFDDSQVAAYYMPLRQRTAGLGNCDLQARETFGCIFDQFARDGTSDSGVKLQGFVFMNSMNYWNNWDRQMDGVLHPMTSEDHSLYPVMGQEIAHRWGSGLRFVDPRSGAVSKKLLGRDGSHWAGWVDSDASVMDGVDWEEQEDGTFLAVNDMFRFSTLDLYTMGALPQQAAKPFFFIDNARFVSNQFVDNRPVPAELTTYLPSIDYLTERGVELRATGEKVDLSIQNVIEAEGQRCPDPDHTQKSFKQLFVLVTAPGQSAASVSGIVADLETAKVVWENWWLKNTERRLSLCATPDAVDCPLAVGGLGSWSLKDESKDGVIAPGEKFELSVDIEALGDENVIGPQLIVELAGAGAENATLTQTEFSADDINIGGKVNVRIPVELSADYICGQSLVLKVRFTSENAADVTEEYRVFPGMKQLSETTFDDENGVDFFVDDENQDETVRGALEKEEVLLSCFMTPQTPERDATPNGSSAFITGAENDLRGDSSLYSDSFDLSSAEAPEFRFAYWLEGAGRLEVSISDDGSAYKKIKTYDASKHAWVSGRVDLSEVYAEKMPEKVWLRFVFDGIGVEGGIDDVRLLDFAGECLPAPTLTDVASVCSCDQSADAKMPWTLSLLSLFGFFWSRRRRNH